MAAPKNNAAPKTDAAEPQLPIEFEPAPGAAELTSEMVTVSTSGDFMLLDPYSGAVVPAFESATVPVTHFISEKIEAGILVKE